MQQVTVDARAAEQLRSLSAGDSIQGRVVAINVDQQGNRTAQVDLGNGAMVNARLSANMSLQNGENVSFTVRQATGGTVTLSPLYTNTAANSTITQALSQAGLFPSDTMTEMVRAMMNEGMSIDRNALLQMSANLNNFPNVNVTTLVHMSHLNVPLLESNIEMFEAYQNYEHQVVSGMEQIFDALPDSFNALLQQEDFGTAMDMYGEVMDLFSEGAEEMVQEGAAQATGEETAQAATSPNAGNVTVTGELPLTAEETATNVAKGEVVNKEAPLSAEEALRNAIAGKAAADVTAIAEENMKAFDKGAATDQSMQFSKAFTDLLRELGVSDATIANLTKAGAQGNQNPFAQLLHELSAAYAKTAHTSAAVDKVWTNLFSTKEYNAVLKEAISSQWLLKPEQVAEKQSVENLYRRLNAQTKALTDILQNTAGADSKVAQSVNNLAR
ncbi:MAG: hypothetical protein IJR58_07530, partial [Lachnospiraceae bacterium]|nr:hypothetical protein [Lachnospiraceae bacterium]